MYARSTTILAHPESIDAGVAHIRDELRAYDRQREKLTIKPSSSGR